MFGLGASEGGIGIGIIFILLAPFIINGFLASSRGKSIPLMLLLTCFFSWIVTLVLAFMPVVKPEED